MSSNKYTEVERAGAVLVARTEDNYAKASKVLGIREGTIAGWDKNTNADREQLVDKISEELASYCDRLAMKLLQNIEKDIDSGDVKGNIQNKTTAAGTLVDKSRLLRNKATTITTNQNKQAHEAVAEKLKKLNIGK